MNKTLFLALAGAFLGAGSDVVGQTGSASAVPPAAPAVTWTVTPTVVSQYMFRGMRLGGPSFQPTVEMGYGALTAGVWASVPFDDTVQGVSDPEIDVYGGYAFTLSDAANLVLGGTWYVFPRAETRAGFYEQTLEPSVALNYTVNGVRFTPKVYYDLMLEGPTFELAAAYAMPLKELGTELNFTATIGTFKWDNAAEDTTPEVKNWGNYWSAGVMLPFQVSANGKVLLGFTYARGWDNETKQGALPKADNALAVGRGVVTLGYSVTF